MVLHIASNCDVIFLDDCDSALASKSLAHRPLVVLLCLNDVATEHLRILYLNLWIVENIIIVVDVLYNLNWLVPLLFLWL